MNPIEQTAIQLLDIERYLAIISVLLSVVPILILSKDDLKFKFIYTSNIFSLMSDLLAGLLGLSFIVFVVLNIIVFVVTGSINIMSYFLNNL